MPLLSKQDIQVVIADDSRIEKCDIKCGMDWSSAEILALASQQIKERFDEGITLEYLDLSKSALDNRIPKLRRKFRKENLPLPVVMINGKPRISGQFDIRMLLDTIEVETELNQPKG